MRTGSLRTGAGLAVLLLLAGTGVRAQTILPAGGPMPSAGAPGAVVAPGTMAPGVRSAGTGLPSSPVPVAMPSSAEPARAPVMISADEKVPQAEPLHAEHHGESHGGHAPEGEGHSGFEGENTMGSAGFFITGDYLYVQPRRRALDFAVV